ncbi:phage tail spike protein [Lacticaseibacillus rhamnosus]|uniref:phage tail spike protein n=1 Tax=Lacticaseibacillus rhamnosus TaxID=47715 RepID=UPI00189F67A3|nr:phage tail spike protein [Lacticaseibacillus rhamnosus]
MDFYFTDRSFHLLGIATAGSDHTNDFRISGEIERTNVDAAMVAFTGTLYFPKKQLSKAEKMCQDLNYMLYMDDDGNGRMITITASHADGTGYCIAFEGTDAGNDLKNEIVGPYKAPTQMTFEQYFDLFTRNSGWDIGANEISTDVRTLTFDSEETSYDRMNSVATQFGVETYFSFSIVGTTMVKCYLNVVKKRGADRGITLRVGDEINRITVDSDSTNLMTSVFARGAIPDGSDTPINLIGYSYTDPTGQFVLIKEGFLLDTVSNRIYSRLRQNSTATVEGGYLNHVIDYDATTQASLLQSALADLKRHNHPAVNYTIELAKIPQNIRCGDTVQIEQEDRQLYLSARVLELDKCYSNPSSSTMVMGDYLRETSQVAKQYQDLAQKIKDIPKTIQYYPWIRYADDDKGTNMSALPTGKKYMAVVYSNKTSVPSDDPADYAGKWALIQGADGKEGVPGKPGADGKTSYFHIAYADSSDGRTNFSLDTPGSRKYIGSYTDFTQADSNNPADYSWQLVQGLQGETGPRGPQGPQGPQGVPGSKDVPYTYIQLDTPANPKKGDTWWHGTSYNDATALQYYDGSKWVDQSIQQAVLSIKKLQSIEIDSATINSPDINVPFQHVSIEGSGIKTSGSLTLNGSSYVITGTVEDPNGNGNGQRYRTSLNPDGLYSHITEPDGVTKMHSNRVSMGTLELSDHTTGSGNNAKYITSSFTALDAVTFYVNEGPYSNPDVAEGTIDYARTGNLVTVTFSVHSQGSVGYRLLANIRPGYSPYYKDRFGYSLRGTSYHTNCDVYIQAGGWYLIPMDSHDWYRGTVTYITRDNYPTGDAHF